jgi:hypothetical protein
MSTKTTISCDLCGKVKGETNGWWKVLLRPAQSGNVVELAVFHWRQAGGIDVCGMQCATQALARFMDHDNLEER